jgi:hypothetical protein
MSVKSFKTSGVGVDLAPQGLVLINTTSFSAVSSVSLPADTFTATYKNYMVIGDLTSSANPATLTYRLRAAGSDNSTTNYFAATTGTDHANTAENIAHAAANAMTFIYTAGANKTMFQVSIITPKETTQTVVTGTGWGTDSGAVQYTGYRIGGNFTAATSFDSASFIANTGTITGTLYCYGINN